MTHDLARLNVCPPYVTAAVVVLIVFALGDVVRACTVFSVVGGGKILFGSNEDYTYAAKAEMWFVPAAHGERGRVLFGWDDFAQGGMNDAGLTFDGASCPPSAAPVDRAKPVVKGNIAEYALARCTTVKDAVALLEGVRPAKDVNGHVMFADATGASAVVEWVSGEVRTVWKKADAQVMTNFWLSKPELGGFPCPRFERATSMLASEKIVDGALAVKVLAGVAQYGREGGREGGTLYSVVYDLTKRQFVVFYKRAFANPLVVDLDSELAMGRHRTTLEQAFRR